MVVPIHVMGRARRMERRSVMGEKRRRENRGSDHGLAVRTHV